VPDGTVEDDRILLGVTTPKDAGSGARDCRLPAEAQAAWRWLMDHLIGRLRFTDGIDRDVYEDAEGRQQQQRKRFPATLQLLPWKVIIHRR
jgi:hypothetical protein